MTLGLTSATNCNPGWCAQLIRTSAHFVIAGACVLPIPGSGLAIAGETSAAIGKSLTEPAPLRIAQRKTTNLGPKQSVDFDFADQAIRDELTGLFNDAKLPAPADESPAPNSFSSAFTSALRDILDQDAKQTPTPAGIGMVPTEPSNATKSMAKVAPPKIGPRLDLATEVPVREPILPLRSAKKSALKRALIEPSVAARAKRPLQVELDEYFDKLPKSDQPIEKQLGSKSPAPAVINKTDLPSAETSAEATATQPAMVTPVVRPRPTEPNVRVTRQMAALQPKLARTLRFYFDRPLNTGEDSAWSIMHSMLGYGPNGQVAINSERGPRTNVVQWMCQNGVCLNRRLLYLQDGYIKGLEGAGFQGHPGQFLAMLAQINVPKEHPLQVQGQSLTVDGLVKSEMFTCSSQKELTFKLISMSHYLASDATWKSETGETWTLPRMLSLEMAQPVNGAACGGTHRVMSISCAVRNRWLRGEPIDGVYAQAEQYVRQYQRYAMTLQNRDGSFSTEWFKRKATSRDKDRQLQTTGHILEWMVYTLPRNELSDPRIVKSVEFLTELMTRHRFRDWEVGPRGHAIRALALYHQRVFERQPSTPQMANAKLWSQVLR